MKKRLYLLRHGQTEFNIRGIAQGRVDSPLTDLGKKQAERVRKYFEDNNIVFNNVYVSPLGRAKQTASIVCDKKAIPCEKLIEISFGDLDGEDYTPAKKYNGDFRIIGGECIEELGQRMYEGLSEIMKKDGNNSILAVSHATASRAFYYKVEAYDDKFRVPNCGLCIYDYEDGKFSFVKLVSVNDD